jgi:hypothetical protein
MIDLKKVIKYLIIIVVLFSFSCKDKLHDNILEQQQNKQDSINKTPEGITLKIEFNKFETLILEGCEYIIYKEHPANNTAMGFMAHKGNCKNPIHCKTE